MITRRLALLSTVATLFVIGNVRADEPVKYRYQMTKDTPVILRTTNEITQKQTIGETKNENVIKSVDVSVRTLEKVDDKGNFQLRSENKRLSLNMKIGPLGEYKFDSQDAEHETGSTLGTALTPVYERLSGAIVKFTHDPRGDVTAVSGMSELLGDILKNNPIGAQFAAGANDEGATMAYGATFVEFPEQAIKPGDTWDVPYELKLPKLGTAKGKSHYTFVGTDKVGDRDTIKLKVTEELSFDIDVKTGPAKVTGTLSISNSEGVAQFDTKRGQLLSKKSSMTLGGNLSVDVNNMTIQIQQEQTHKILIERLEQLPR